MSGIEMKLEVEAEDFAEDLNDEALDRKGARSIYMCPQPCQCLGGRGLIAEVD